MGYQPYAAPMAQPAEVQSIKSMLHIVRILAIIFGILLALGGLAYAAAVAAAYSACNAAVGVYCSTSGALGFLLIGPIFLVIFGVVDVIIYLQMKQIESLVDQRQYEQAKSKTLVWMILGFILGGIIIGILLLIAYLKFDPLINWARSGGAAAPAYGTPYPAAAPMAAAPPIAPPPAAAPAPAPAAAPAPTTPCPRCGKPATWVPQYNRWYCSAEQQYL